MRLLEAETSLELGIPFDHNWYTIDTYARAQMIAGRIIRTALNNLETKQYTENMRR